jgi:centractin
MIDLGTERYRISETLFNTSMINNPNPSNTFLSQFKANSREEFQGIAQMIINSISRSDADIRRDLFNNIILTGGNTLISGFPERFFEFDFEINKLDYIKNLQRKHLRCTN